MTRQRGAGDPAFPAATRDILMTAPPPRDPADSLACALILSASAGYLDAFTFLGHGHSFASAMTGNMVLLGVNLGHSTADALGSFYPLLAFAVGATVADFVGRPGVRRHLPLPAHLSALIVEVAVLCAVAVLPVGFDDRLLVSVVALTTAVQNTTFRNIGTRPYNSTIMTGNLQNLAKSLVGEVWTGGAKAREQARNLATVIASFIAGAAAGSAATPRFGNPATLAPAVLLAVLAAVLAVMLVRARSAAKAAARAAAETAARAAAETAAEPR